MKTIGVLIVALVISPAGYAWQPCLPFCDMACGGVALTELGVNVTAAMQQQTGTNKAHLQALSQVARSVVDLGVNSSNAWTNATRDQLSALDARTDRLQLAQLMAIKAGEVAADTLTNTFAAALRQAYVVERVSENQAMLGPSSMPETGEIGALAAADRKTAYLKSQQLVMEITGKQQTYINELKQGDTSIAVSARLSAVDGIDYEPLLEASQTLSDDNLNHQQAQLTYLTNPKPLPVLDDATRATPEGERYELARRVYNSNVMWIYAIADQLIASRAKLASADWVRSYAHRDSADTGLSFSESLGSLILGRISSEGWHANIKRQNETGLQRELTYLRAEENVLLFVLSQRRSWRNQLLALIVLQKLRAKQLEVAALAI